MFFRTNQKISSKIVSLIFGVLVLCFALSFWVLAVWQEPGVPPPGDNVPAPLNVGDTPQTKSGGLVLNTGGAPTGLYVVGNVAIGTLNVPTERLEVDGNIKLLGITPSYKIMNVATPTAANDVAIRGWVEDYVDAANGGGGPTEIQGRRQPDNTWEKIADFGYYNTTGACDIQGNCYNMAKGIGQGDPFVVRRNGVEVSDCINHGCATIGSNLIRRESGVVRRYCTDCQGGKINRSYTGGGPASNRCWTIIPGCTCTATGEANAACDIMCCSYWYDALRVR